ncbi:hypothetical protein B7494_g7447 [Chlorociboria aeruginascens]|nr:hypothetical protein B7494_g7447 [Chlorociboria aeruginascens]
MSRQWIEEAGSWSCRIKFSNTSSGHRRGYIDTLARTNVTANTMATAAVDTDLGETASPNPRRKDKIEEALQSMATLTSNMDDLSIPADPDAQATVTDFLDFTEYLPSDMIRSLSLVGKLDRRYSGASTTVHDYTKTYGKLPSLTKEEKPDTVKLKADISQTLEEAASARELSEKEASRMASNVDRHLERAKTIYAKLQAMYESTPESREASPAPQKTKSAAVTRPPKIVLRLDGGRSATENGINRVRKRRAARITVPGEVLAPYELDYESYGSGTDWHSDDESVDPRLSPGRQIKQKLPKVPKLKIPKPPRPPRPPGVMGTNVHSSVAGISTSNALAKLQPPPSDAQPGSEHAPWLKLTPYELALLRKDMKKNAVWCPSTTMIHKKLHDVGRGPAPYVAAKKKAEEAGEPFDFPVPPEMKDAVAAVEAGMVLDVSGSSIKLTNRGMKMNEAKKLRKETHKDQANKLAKLAAEEAEQSARKMAAAAEAMKEIFNKHEEEKPPTKTPSRPAARKRKRESIVENEFEKAVEKNDEAEPARLSKPHSKRNKTETPVPAPQSTAGNSTPRATPGPAPDSATSIVAPISLRTDPSSLVAPAASPTKQSSTPILPPIKDKKDAKKDPKKDKKAEMPVEKPVINTRNLRRSSIAATSTPLSATAPALPPTPALEALPPWRPTSSRGKASSTEPNQKDTATATIDRPRRASTARNTPAPESRQTKRTKRPAPGVVSATSEGATAVSVGKRSAAPRKKANQKKVKKEGRESSAIQEVMDEIDDDGNVIDPNEPRYCCEKEWFHLECVGLTAIPPRTTKWYCPDCRITLGIGEKGEVNARGKKK